MIIRDATEADLPAIVAIFNAAVRTRMSSAQLAPVTVEERLPWFHQHSPNRHPLWAVENAGTIAGWLKTSSMRARNTSIVRGAGTAEGAGVVGCAGVTCCAGVAG